MTVMGKLLDRTLSMGVPADPARKAPLTPAQAGLLLQSALSGIPALNVIQIVARFEGEDVNPRFMAQAWQAMADRHPALRLAIDAGAEEGPQQSVLPSVSVQMTTHDWSHRTVGDQENALAHWLAADKTRGAAVDAVPNWRVAWLRLGARRSVLVWTFHHAVLDGTSFRLVLDDLFTVYDGLCNRRAARLAPLPAAPGFLDHCDAVAAQDKSAAVAHFRALLSGFDAPNALPATFCQGASGTMSERRFITTTLSAADSRAIHARAQAAGATAANLVSAAWGLVLTRVSGRSGAVFGLTRSGRHLLPDAANVAGCLINTLPVRVDADSDTTVDALLTELRGQTLAAQPFETVSPSDIAAASDIGPERALFDSIVMFDRGSLAVQMQAKGPDWQSRHICEISHIATPVTVAVYDDPQMLVQFEYDPSRLSGAGAARLAEYLNATLRALAAAPPGARLGDIDMLPAAERSALLALGQPDHPTPTDAGARGVVARFADAAARFPERPAVSQIGVPGRLSYAQLDSRADQIAAKLQHRGVRVGDTVGLALPRGADYVAALLGALKAGASFVPLDPTYPAAVLADMVDRAGLACLVCQGTFAQTIGMPDIPTLSMTQDLGAEAVGPALPQPVGYDPARRAYVIFTSGSSGQPKGVEVSHNALAHHADAAIGAYRLTHTDRVLQFTSQSFDISIEEILPTLLAGGHLVLRNDAVVQSGHDFVTALDAQQITVLNLPTAFWHALAEHLEETGGAALPSSLRLLIAGGERVSPTVLARWRGMFPGLRWLNGYGPTEATITATLYDPAEYAFDGGDVPIGRPFGHARAYVACVDGSLAPMGVDGELWVGGPAVAHGYLGREDLTRAAFLPDRFASGATPADRVYRTGDRVAWRGDGTLRYFGRMDRQVKLRGYRIEPAAIEAALERHTGVGVAVVAVDNPDSAHAQLLAWVRPRAAADAPLCLRELQASLSEHLPAHMLPVIQIVADLPQTPGGKTDVARLPRPAAPQPAAAPAQTDAATQKLQAIFARLLDTARVDPDVSFFDLGGHSLLSVRLMSLIQRDFGQRLTLATLYQFPTARGLASELGRAGARPGGLSCIVPIQPAGNGPPLFMVQVLGPEASYIRPLAAHLAPRRPVYGLTIDMFDPDTPATIPEIAAIYCANIQSQYPTGPICLAAVSNGAYMALELAQQLVAAGRNVAGLYFLDASGPGGRPQNPRQATTLGYLRQLVHNFGGVVRGRSHHAWMTLRFEAEKLRLRLSAHRALPMLAQASDAALVTDLAHQAKLALLIKAYHPAPYPRLITVFRSKEQTYDSKAAISSGLGWAPVAAVGFEMIDVPGYHLTTLQDPNVHALARIISRKMQAIEAGQGAAGLDRRRRVNLQPRSSDSTEFSKIRPASVTLRQSS
ncbi:non-ribosomal peptide synthetase [Roseicitreum antarcticum]|uniref:Amino acid adenylation domain-containing protein n=1 Tax=Roseicitreum antarcticum TaxID=564137 RepID=A0A1H2QWF2_9RHOB|nr:non-ribosomal peptide synthetase [Roseicitreum antarcticum]SDW11522.1 amino acid adenylation domain-containing protein [Roseicitreum antarcticum]